MARARQSFVPISLLLLASLAAAAAAAADPEEGDLRISVQYATEEESRWMDRWAEKYSAQGSGDGFKIQPATDEESARINSMFTGGGYDGHIEFDDDHPYVPSSSHPSCPHTKFCSACFACYHSPCMLNFTSGVQLWQNGRGCLPLSTSPVQAERKR